MMATKGSINNHQHRSASTRNDSKIDPQYNEYLFNVTQNSYDFVPVQSPRQSFNNNDSRFTATDFDPDDSYQVRAYRDMTINTPSERTFNYLDTTSEEEPQNHRRKTNSTNPKNIDNSTLSLHIAEHENSIQSLRSVNPNTNGLSFGPPSRNAKKNLDLSFINDPFKPLRRVENEPVAAEIMPFKTSQKLINVNSSVMKKIPPKPLPRSRPNVVDSISNDQYLNVTRNLPDLERTYTIPLPVLERTTSSIFGSTSDARTVVTDASVFLDGYSTSKESNNHSASLSTIQNDESTLNKTVHSVNKTYELLKMFQSEGRKPELFDMEKLLCNHDDLNFILYDPATQNSDHELPQEQLPHASEGAELGHGYPTQFDAKDFQSVPQQDFGQQQHGVYAVEGDTIFQTSWKDEKIVKSKFLNENSEHPVEGEHEISYLNQPYEEPLGHEVNHNFNAQQVVQEPQIQPLRCEIKFATRRPPTSVMVEGDSVTKLNEFLPYKEDVQVRPPYSQIEVYDNRV